MLEKGCVAMWIYTTNNQMINVAEAERIELRQETTAPGEVASAAPGAAMTGISIVAHFADCEAQLAFIPAADNYDIVVSRYWNAIRTAIKTRAELCDLMDIV
jgi:hypothetical protein